ncbi:alpha/beta fold hydrolase [Paraburkholderia sp. MM5384-R2]|uniref:alpha/beta fold hydrolase n=1 Tax=Paraburkholderia sp. MM5384-R2 TaxID=2723097 RepID=UPI00160B80B7|nr:hypothetical protein [Paraburkholderia sp. MM5384-R2]MBB5502168.1 pimeloyl-ACP methyl ester carboxylesterase [Paraburkholderia sp. MM5384-R2]
MNRNPGSTADWTRLVARVGEFGRALAMDMPGFGNADKPEQFDYRVRGYAPHPGRLLVECNVQRARLVMDDFGGPWGLAWAAANPRTIASVTLINAGILLDYGWPISRVSGRYRCWANVHGHDNACRDAAPASKREPALHPG